MEATQNQYRRVLMEIKKRTAVILAFESGQSHAIYRLTTVESSYLQIRKILELIALGSMVANKDIYSEHYEKFASHWHAERILNDLEKVNPHFYPRPIEQNPTSNPDIKSEWSDVPKSDYLTRAEFARVYNECGDLMHAANPFAKTLDTAHYQARIPVICSKIIGLLQAHTISLVGEEKNVYLFQMNEDGRWPSYTPFTRIRKLAED